MNKQNTDKEKLKELLNKGGNRKTKSTIQSKNNKGKVSPVETHYLLRLDEKVLTNLKILAIKEKTSVKQLINKAINKTYKNINID